MDITDLKRIGFSDKSATVYLALLSLGPSSVRSLAANTGLNRGTVHDVLKDLRTRELVTFYAKDAKQYFVAEDPVKLHETVIKQREALQDTSKKILFMLPELRSIYNKGGERPVARYYEGDDIHKILEDVLSACEQNGETEYRVYSTAGVREHLYKGFETFSDVRVAKGLAVKAVAIGEGGELRGLDERKWLAISYHSPTYIIIYSGKTAYISLNAKGEPVGVVIDNQGVHEMMKGVFEELWKKL